MSSDRQCSADCILTIAEPPEGCDFAPTREIATRRDRCRNGPGSPRSDVRRRGRGARYRSREQSSSRGGGRDAWESARHCKPRIRRGPCAGTLSPQPLRGPGASPFIVHKLLDFGVAILHDPSPRDSGAVHGYLVLGGQYGETKAEGSSFDCRSPRLSERFTIAAATGARRARAGASPARTRAPPRQASGPRRAPPPPSRRPAPRQLGRVASPRLGQPICPTRNPHNRTITPVDGRRPLDQSGGAVKEGERRAWTVQEPAPSPCAMCRRLVTGHAGDAKVVVEHIQAVFCSDCFECHPNREEWTRSMADRGRPAHRRPPRSRR
jgi:hypothetical protein